MKKKLKIIVECDEKDKKDKEKEQKMTLRRGQFFISYILLKLLI